MGKITKDELGLEITFLAVREALMDYFKGSCVERMVSDSNVQLRGTVGLRFGTRTYQYERREQENSKPMSLLIGEVEIAKLKQYPEKITLLRSTLKRSKELRGIMSRIEMFMDEYLMGVEVEYEDGNIYE